MQKEQIFVFWTNAQKQKSDIQEIPGVMDSLR